MKNCLLILFFQFITFFTKGQDSTNSFIIVNLCDSCIKDELRSSFLLNININYITLNNNEFTIIDPPDVLLSFDKSAIVVNERGKHYNLDLKSKEGNLMFSFEKKSVSLKKEGGMIILNSYYGVLQIICFSSLEEREVFIKEIRKIKFHRIFGGP